MNDTQALRRQGLILVTVAVVAWSTAGFFVRLIGLDAWTILFWRGVFAGAIVAAIAWWQRGSPPWPIWARMGGPGWIVAAMSSLSMLAFVSSLRLTTVADVAVIYATVPLGAALLAWLVLGERISRSTLIASGVALAGVIIMVGAKGMSGSLAGDLLAGVMMVSMSVLIVTARRHQDIPMIEASSLSSLLTAIIAAPFADLLAPSPTLFAYLLIFAVVQMSLGLTLFSLGAKYVPVAQSALVSALEAPLAPLWVWLAFGELPGRATFVGGALVIGAVVGQIALERGRDLDPLPPPP
jgi:drug/metabolite transporter (DMT)-like permease